MSCYHGHGRLPSSWNGTEMSCQDRSQCWHFHTTRTVMHSRSCATFHGFSWNHHWWCHFHWAGARLFEAESQAEFWGALVCGTTGLVRAAPRRLVPLIDITVSTLTLGFATVALLQSLAGALVSILQFRRRMLCLLDEIYVAQHGRLQSDVVRLSKSLQDELWMLVCLGPLAVTDLRAQTEDTLFLTDASEEIKASVQCPVPLAFARELHRHSLVRGCWTRLLSPWKVWLQPHFQLEDEDALPDGVPLISHPIWLVLAQVLKFQVFHRKLVRGRKHINILELESILELEEKLSLKHQDVRYLLGSDSQIALAAILKGRSSSPRLNSLLQRHLATTLGAGIYGSYGYVPSLANVGDDPTRWTDVREPSCEIPSWLQSAFLGQFEEFDKWLGERGYDPISVAQLPFPSQFPESTEILQYSLLKELRAVQKPSRLAAFDEKVYKGFSQETAADEGKPECGIAIEQDFEKRPEESFNLRPKQIVASTSEVAAEVSRSPKVGSCTVVKCLGSKKVDCGKRQGQQEPGGQTKILQTRLLGKMNQGHHDSVVSKGESQPREINNTTGSPPEPPLGRTRFDVEAMENPKSPLLGCNAKKLLEKIPNECFLLPGGRRLRVGEKFNPKRAGVLDLYSGKAAVAKRLAKRYKIWVITVDFEHGSNQNLLDATLQDLLKELVAQHCFVGLGAAPECSSFSRAVCPAVRSALEPWGMKNISEKMKVKVETGNSHAAFLLEILQLCISMDIWYWVENPDGSFLWLLPGWSAAGIGKPEISFRVDLCRYKTPWRKRTRIATNTGLAGVRQLCVGGHSHTLLRGRNKTFKMSWTRMAQVYPRGLANDLAASLATAAGLVSCKEKLAIGGCAKCSESRIGEAKNPGPQKPQRTRRDVKLLEEVQLVEPVTKALQQRIWTAFQMWLDRQFSPETVEQLMLCPALLAAVLKTYGLHLFSSGHALYEYRHLLVIAQQTYSWLKQHLGAAWQLLTKWEVLQPIQHRRPLHYVLYQAMVVSALCKGWLRWTGTLVLGFEGIARISEVLRATRADLVLPSDQFSSLFGSAFLRVLNPKTKRRGKGRVQHLKLHEKHAIAFLERTFAALDPSLCLFPLSAAAFRTRWEQILDELEMPRQLRPTPASIRGGGAIVAYQKGEPIQDIMWRMRVQSQTTLEHYLQEMAADSIMTRLPETSKHRIKSAALLFPLLIEHPGSWPSFV